MSPNINCEALLSNIWALKGHENLLYTFIYIMMKGIDIYILKIQSNVIFGVMMVGSMSQAHYRSNAKLRIMQTKFFCSHGSSAISLESNQNKGTTITKYKSWLPFFNPVMSQDLILAFILRMFHCETFISSHCSRSSNIAFDPVHDYAAYGILKISIKPWGQPRYTFVGSHMQYPWWAGSAAAIIEEIQ